MLQMSASVWDEEWGGGKYDYGNYLGGGSGAGDSGGDWGGYGGGLDGDSGYHPPDISSD